MRSVAQAQSFAAEPETVLAELKAGLSGISPAVVLLFLSPRDDLAVLVPMLVQAFAPGMVLGCTSAGEIGPAGYSVNSVVAVALDERDFSASAVLLSDLHQFTPSVIQKSLSDAAVHLAPGNRFALTLFDGLCGMEEPVISAIHAALRVDVAGGSAGDGMRFGNTPLIYQGRLVTDAAIVLLVSTRLPFKVFKTEHFKVGDTRLVVTRADAQQRVVLEINGRPAAGEYARLIGADPDQVTAGVFARHPLLVRVGGAIFIRSVRSVGTDGSLSFFCAIDTGLVMRIGEGQDITRSLAGTFDQIREEIGPPALCIGFDCVLRRLEIAQAGHFDRVGDVLIRNNVAGFSTYGPLSYPGKTDVLVKSFAIELSNNSAGFIQSVTGN
jgi:hypothetical protein